MPDKQERLRIDIWAGLKPKVEAEMARKGLTAQEFVNTVLVSYFDSLTTSREQHVHSVVESSETTEEDYI